MIVFGSKILFRADFYLILIFISCLLEIMLALKIDLSKAVVYYGTKGSMFGFTVAGYKQKYGKNGIFVGAPKNRDKQFSRVEWNYQGGSVYYCDVDLTKNKYRGSKCEEISFPTENYRSLSDSIHIEEQWLGASLVTSESEGVVVACAPRAYKILENRDFDVTYPVGVCYYSKKGPTNFVEYFPNKLEWDPRLHSDFASQTGFSVTISKDSEMFYLGAVSSMVFNVTDAYGCVFGLNMVDTRKEIIVPDPIKLSSLTTNSYFGYAVTSLNFYGTKIIGVAVASPKAEQLRGKVTIFTSSFSSSNSKDLVGQQFAAYFGYSICTSDVDGDGADDIIIGAPLYSHNFNSLDERYDSGRIYVYYQGNDECSIESGMCWDERFNRVDFIDGEFSRGRFGSAIASLGDINRDGIGDIAVSAPYEESSHFKDQPEVFHTGAVYIYLGSKRGIVKKYSHVVRASDVYHQNQMKSLSLNSFGVSLYGGIDFDGNSCPDLVVGAYESDVVFLFFIQACNEMKF